MRLWEQSCAFPNKRISVEKTTSDTQCSTDPTTTIPGLNITCLRNTCPAQFCKPAERSTAASRQNKSRGDAPSAWASPRLDHRGLLWFWWWPPSFTWLNVFRCPENNSSSKPHMKNDSDCDQHTSSSHVHGELHLIKLNISLHVNHMMNKQPVNKAEFVFKNKLSNLSNTVIYEP